MMNKLLPLIFLLLTPTVEAKFTDSQFALYGFTEINISYYSENVHYTYADENSSKAFINYWAVKQFDNVPIVGSFSINSDNDYWLDTAYLTYNYDDVDITAGAINYYQMTLDSKASIFGNGLVVLPQGVYNNKALSYTSGLVGVRLCVEKPIRNFGKVSLYTLLGTPYIKNQDKTQIALFGNTSPFVKIKGVDSSVAGINVELSNSLSLYYQYARNSFKLEKGDHTPNLPQDYFRYPQREWSWVLLDKAPRGTVTVNRIGFKKYFIKPSIEILGEAYMLDFYNKLISENNEMGSKGYFLLSRKYFTDSSIFLGYTEAKSNHKEAKAVYSWFTGFSYLINSSFTMTVQLNRVNGTSWFYKTSHFNEETDKIHEENYIVQIGFTYIY